MNNLTEAELREVFKDPEAFKIWFRGLSEEQRQAFENLLAELKEAADE